MTLDMHRPRLRAQIFKLLVAVAPDLCVRCSGCALRMTPHRFMSLRSSCPLSLHAYSAYSSPPALGGSSLRPGQRLRLNPQERTH